MSGAYTQTLNKVSAGKHFRSCLASSVLGEFSSQEGLHMGPDLVGFCAGEDLQYPFTPVSQIADYRSTDQLSECSDTACSIDMDRNN